MQYRPLSETKFINDANLVSYYKLEDVNDSKGANTLTNNGTVTFDAAIFSNGANLGSSNSTKSLSKTDTASLKITGNITISAWINPSSAPTFTCVAGKFLDSTHKSYWLAFNGGKAGMYISTNGSNQTTDSLSATLSNGTWYHIVGTYDGTNTKIYVNGSLANSIGQTGGIYDSTGDLAIGKLGSAASDYFSGLIDDVAIFNRALTSGEVNELYQGMTFGEYLGAGSGTTKLLLHLNGNSTDSSGNGVSVTNNGSAGFVQSRFGGGIDLGTSNSTKYLSVASDFGINGGNVTVSFWAKVNTEISSGNFKTFFDLSDSTSKTTFRASYYSPSSGVYNVLFDRSRRGVADDRATAVISALGTSNYYHFTLTYDGTDVKGYINGALVGSAVASGNGSTYTGSDLTTLGTYIKNDGAIEVNGLSNIVLDEVIVENRAWTASEIKKYYTNSRGRF